MIDYDTFRRGLSMLHSEAMLTYEEAMYLYDTARNFERPITWVELGSWVGRSYWCAGCGLPDGSTLIGVDECSGMLPDREGSDNLIQWAPSGRLVAAILLGVVRTLKELRPENRYEFIVDKTSRASLPWGAVETDQRIDVLLVDAAHDYASVKQDLADWLPLVRAGGLVICHDYTRKFPGVVKAVNSAARKLSPTGQEVRQIPDTRYAVFNTPAL